MRRFAVRLPYTPAISTQARKKYARAAKSVRENSAQKRPAARKPL